MKLYGNKINKILLCIFLLIIVVKLFDVGKINTFDVMKGNNISDVEKNIIYYWIDININIKQNEILMKQFQDRKFLY